MVDWERVAGNLLARLTGPMKFRLVLQPLMASILAVRAGLADAKAGRPPYFWNLLTDRAHFVSGLQDGWRSIGRVFLFATVLDAVFQAFVFRFVYPGEVIVVAFFLAIVPYVIVRGAVVRMNTRRMK